MTAGIGTWTPEGTDCSESQVKCSIKQSVEVKAVEDFPLMFNEGWTEPVEEDTTCFAGFVSLPCCKPLWKIVASKACAN